MTRNEFIRRFPNASESTIAANCSDGLASSAVSERSSGDESVGAPSGPSAHPTKSFVRVTSYRVRLLDKRNLHEKAFVDALQKCGAIVDDSPKWCEVEVEQVKVDYDWQQKTVIEIIW